MSAMMSGNAKRKFNDECLVEVNHVSKKFCRNLQMSLQYGIRDLMREAVGLGSSRELRRGEFYAVKDANFTVRRGESVALLGPNGTGKSTMLKLINGLLKPNQGSIRIRGKVGALTALGAGFDPILTGRENIYINGAVLGMNKLQVDARFDEIVDFSELGDKVETPVKNYSSGERSRLGYSVAAFLQTDLLLMDEILATGDLRFKAKCFNHLEQLLDQGTAIILVSHAVGRLQRICRRAIVFNEGETAFDGDIKEGISLYERMLNLEQFSKGVSKESDNVKTTTAWVETVELIDSIGNVIEKAQHGDDVRIRIHMLASKLIVAPRVFIAIESTSGVIGATVSPPRAFNLDADGYTVELSFPSLPLLQGTYLVNVRLTDHSSKEIYHFRKGVMLLRVESDLKSGFVALDHHWDY